MIFQTSREASRQHDSSPCWQLDQFFDGLMKGLIMPRPFNPNTYHGWRKLVIKRDVKCVICGSEDELECDHIKPVKTHPELIYNLENGRLLCKSCHKKTDTYGGKALKGRRVDKNPYGGSFGGNHG